MYCTNCGKKIEEGELFCTNCGNKLNNEEEKIEKEEVKTNDSHDQNLKQEETKENDLKQEEVKLEEVKNDNAIEQKPKKKKINKVPFIIIGIVLIVLLIALLIVKLIVFSPKNIFFKGINKAYSNISDKFDNLKSNDNNKDKIVNIKTNTTINLEGNEYYFDSSVTNLFDILNELEIELNETIDNKTLNFDMSTTLSNDSGKLSLESYKRDNDSYFKLVDIYDKYISVPLNIDTNIDTISNEDIDYTIKTIKDIFLKSLDSSKFEQSKDVISIQDKDLEVSKTSYLINSEEAKRIIEKMVIEIKKDDKLLEILLKNSDTTKEQLIDSLEELPNMIDLDSQDTITIDVYTKGVLHDVIAYDINLKGEDSSVKLFFSKYDDIDEIRVLVNGMAMINITTKSLDNNTSETTITALTLTANITSKKTNDETNITIKAKEISSNIDFEGNLVIDNSKFNLNSKINVDNEQLFKLDVNTTYEINDNATLKNINTNNSVTPEEISDVELEEIFQKLQENKFISRIMNSLIENSYSYDVTYDYEY